MKGQDMTQRYRKFKRAWGMWYAFDTVTGNSVSLKTRVKAEAVQKVAAMNETERQPSISLGLAKVYLNATDPKLATRTWQEVMEHIVARKSDETQRRWETAIKDKNFDCIRNLPVAETRPEHFDRALADGKVSTNVYLRRIHNHALGKEWLLKSVIQRLQWPRSVFKSKRAITAEEHCRIIEAETAAAERNQGSRNSDRPHYDERRDFYELLWHTGAAQSDAAWLMLRSTAKPKFAVTPGSMDSRNRFCVSFLFAGSRHPSDAFPLSPSRTESREISSDDRSKSSARSEDRPIELIASVSREFSTPPARPRPACGPAIRCQPYDTGRNQPQTGGFFVVLKA